MRIRNLQSRLSRAIRLRMPDDLDYPRGPRGPGQPGAKRRQQTVVPEVRSMHIHDSFFLRSAVAGKRK